MRRVAVTGLGVISPVGNTTDTFFESLTAGKHGIGLIDRFDTSALKCRVAAEVKDFDPLLYMEKNDARRMDLFSQYAIAAAVQAMADSGLDKDMRYAPERFGVYVGSGIGGFHTWFAETQKLLEKGPNRVSPFFIPMMIGNIGTGNIAIRFNARGPCLPVVSACSTGANAVGEAFRAIKHGYADVILAGGAEATIEPLAIAGFTACMALTGSEDPDRASIPFDKERDGFVMGEGAGVIVLEDYDGAVRRGARIYAEIAGYGNTCDAYHITAPRPEAVSAAECIRMAMDEAGLTGEETLYINAHGTSTQLNDKTETLAFKTALGENAYKAYISSTKSMTGHMLGAAGGAETVVCVKALQTGTVPPTAGYRVPDPECDLNIVPNASVRAPLTAALTTSFGFGGHNACIALKAIDN
ncbi:MAG: beta-ketoacyl-ACP synthase II [Oscillospiraceae bacterium]|jgi:3-oxoacyl-[acyl-carrier-protein] synthase II|nr:beta-ketoacyl-ACP synthase II [Oscillospiraceae bacterium]